MRFSFGDATWFLMIFHVSYRLNTYDFHIIDERISVRPGIGRLAGEWLDVDLLGRIQIVQCFRE